MSLKQMNEIIKHFDLSFVILYLRKRFKDLFIMVHPYDIEHIRKTENNL